MLAFARSQRHPNARSRHNADELAELLRQAERERALSRKMNDDKHRAASVTLRVVKVLKTTPDSVCIFFEHLGYRTRGFVPGQFLLLHGEHEGKPVQRAYSIFTAPDDELLGVCVRAVPGGALSTQLQEVEAGDSLRVSGPHGRFHLPETQDGAQATTTSEAAHVVLVAGGVGITPLLSIARQLAGEGRTFHLLYASRDYEHIVLREELEELVAHTQGASCSWVLDTPARHNPAAFSACVGPPDEALFEQELPVDSSALYMLCGPEGLMERARAWLRQEGVDDDRILQETFVDQSAGEHAVDDALRFSAQPLRFAQSGREVSVAPGQTLLDAGMAAGEAMPFSCTMGGCAACRVRLLEGQVHMQEPNCLTAQERDEGYCLACIARPLSPVTIDR